MCMCVRAPVRKRPPRLSGGDMSDLDRYAKLDVQLAELIALLESALVEGLDPYLVEAVNAAIAAAKLRGDALLSGRVFATVGGTYETILATMQRLAGLITDVRGDAAGWHTDQERDTARIAAGIAAALAGNLIHTAEIAQLRQENRELRQTLRDMASHRGQKRAKKEATAPHTG